MPKLPTILGTILVVSPNSLIINDIKKPEINRAMGWRVLNEIYVNGNADLPQCFILI